MPYSSFYIIYGIGFNKETERVQSNANLRWAVPRRPQLLLQLQDLAHILRTVKCAVASISPVSYLFGEAVSDLVEELPLSALVAEHVHRRHALAPADPAGCHGDWWVNKQ